jgi:hypothetical protein
MSGGSIILGIHRFRAPLAFCLPRARLQSLGEPCILGRGGAADDARIAPASQAAFRSGAAPAAAPRLGFVID